jgi:acetolactate synthase-1/2/3 large subunit
MLYDPVHHSSLSPVIIEKPMPDEAALDQLADMIKAAHSPIIIAGGSCWSDHAITSLETLAITADIPVVCSFRRQRLMNNLSPAYAGDLGLGCNPAILSRIKDSDLVILLGGRMSEIPSQSYSLFDIPHPQMRFVHIHRDHNELGRVYIPNLSIASIEDAVIDGLLARMDTAAETPRINTAHADFLDWTAPIPEQPGQVNMSKLVTWMRDHLPPESIMTNGAGNYATWLHRFYYFRDSGSQLAPTSGSMGYGIPAAVAASLRYPDRPVIAFAGDGCFQMTMPELATAYQAGAKPIIFVIDNGMYGTIRMHQERHFPGRGQLTSLVNPDFVKLAESMGCIAYYVDHDAAFPDAMTAALTADRPVLIHIRIDPESITPAMSLSQITAQARQA